MLGGAGWPMRLATYARLGPASLARVAVYRAGLRTGLHPALRIAAEPAQGPFFAASQRDEAGLQATGRWLRSMPAFCAHHLPLDDPPLWNEDPFHPGGALDGGLAWHRIPDFAAPERDIKAVWEASRMDWVPAMAQRAALGDASELDRLNRWLADWQSSAPPYRGPNWKCGQEAAIRVLHLAAAALVTDQIETALPGLIALVRQHLARIAPTLGYAIGQNNNHGTSEAAALFIGGSWLALHGDPAASRLARRGHRLLDERCATLIADDGTFSQYSVVYHRLMLDTCSLAEIWGRRLSLKPFSSATGRKLVVAVEWLRQLVDPGSGDAPNLGANDGALLIPLTDATFRDFRPSLQLAAALFCNTRAIAASGPWDEQLRWLRVALPDRRLDPLRSRSFDSGGLHVLRRAGTVAYLRYPRFRFRPSQCDLLHLDLWVDGRNLVRDGGSFSYAAPSEEAAAFAGVAGHSTASFDGREQMPRLGRFLLGAWPQAREVIMPHPDAAEPIAAAGYRDWCGAEHHRTVRLDQDRLTCIDRLGGKASSATIRWRLAPGTWELEGATLRGNGVSFRFASAEGDISATLTSGWESRHYLERTPLPVLELRVSVPALVTTEICT